MASMDPGRPNIVFILSDDQGEWALGSSGNSEIITPNLDRLAAEGMRFDHFFCVSPVCSPARASLLTGRIPSQHGVHDWIREGNVGAEAVEYLQGLKGYTEVLADNGYVCGISGKWHLGASDRLQQGFSFWYVHQRGGSSYYNTPMVKDGRLINETKYITTAITDEAIGFIERQAADEAPFYLSIHYTAPHSPWIGNHPQQFIDLYEDCPFETCPQGEAHPWAIWADAPDAPTKDTLANPREQLKGYYAAVTAMDMNIGRVLDRLDALGLADNTLVIFTSDNGFNCGHHGIWGKGNGTFPLNMYDTSIKVPFLIRHPGRIPAGRVCSDMVSGYDFMPTLLDYVGLPVPDSDKLPGGSFAELLKDAASGSGPRERVVVYDEYGATRMIRTKEWKYVHRYPYGPDELYDLLEDPAETSNRIDDEQCQAVARAMKANLEEWFLRYVEPGRDGTKERVSGNGQLSLSGIRSGGKEPFHPLGETWTLKI